MKTGRLVRRQLQLCIQDIMEKLNGRTVVRSDQILDIYLKVSLISFMMDLIMRSEKRVKDDFKISDPQRNRVDIY